MLLEVIAALALAIWAYLLAARGGFWLARERDDVRVPEPRRWPRVTAVIPARNEADGIAQSIGSLARQDYPGAFSIVLVDDDSDDGTADVARRAAAALSGGYSFSLIQSHGVAPGWTGKLWALRQGVEAAANAVEPPDYVLLTDADIVHAPDSVRALVARAEAGRYVLTSLMAKLRCQSAAERVHVPAFVYFFDMLYPFAWVNDARRQVAAAAGGCMLVKADALHAAGGIESIRGALIDDCSLARKMKAVGPIWLGLTDWVSSIREYDWAEAKKMISRSAYAQLNYSPLLLALVTVAMALTFLAGPLLALLGTGLAQAVGAITWALMALSFQPMLRFYKVSRLWGLALPAIAAAYMLYTLDSAYRSLRGRGGEWKGRVRANVPGIMTANAAEQLRSGKGPGDENFPVASWLLAREHRRPVLAFYEFVRIADDISDHPQLKPEDKLAHLDALERSLLGRDDAEAAGVTLRQALAERKLSPQHAQDLLRAFRQDVTKLRYDDWDDLIGYCRYSAMPVGRFVLDVHGESRATWPASDNVCAVLQIINHLQDCVKDYRALDRVYIPLDALKAAGSGVEALGEPKSSPQLLACLHGLAARTGAVLEQGAMLPAQINDTRLSMEIAAIVTLARHFVRRLRDKDPLSENVRLGKLGVATIGLGGAVKELFARLLRAPGAVSRSPAE